MALDQRVFFADIHVHPELPFLGTSFHRIIHEFSWETHLGLSVVAFYEHPFPTRAWAFRRLLRRIDSFVERYGKEIHTGPTDDPQPKKYILSIESLRILPSPRELAILWEKGIRVLQPMHFFDNRYGHSCGEDLVPVSKKGLTEYGVELLQEADRMGFIIDLAHMNGPTMWDTLNEVRRPVICSHTGVQSLVGSQRNIPAKVAKEVLRRGGLIGVMPWRHLHRGPITNLDEWTARYAETIMELSSLGGFNGGICIGSDRGAPIFIHPKFYLFNQVKTLREQLFAKDIDGEARWHEFLFENAHRYFLKHIGPCRLPIPSPDAMT